jgi:hypothetical protein
MTFVNASDESTDVTNKRRSERVVLIVPIQLSVKLDDGRTASEEARTQVVNAHGGLLKARLQLVAGEEFLLTNPKTSVSARCRVVRTEQKEPPDLLIAFQFEKPEPTFWPIVFPPKDWATANLTEVHD